MTRRLLATVVVLGSLLAPGLVRAADDPPVPAAGEEPKPAAEDAKPAADGAKPAPVVAIPAIEQAPVRYPPTRVRLPLILGGLGFTAAAYAASAGTAYGWDYVPGAQSLYIPVAGPWMALAENRCPADGSECDPMIYARGILEALSGLAQLGGLAVAAQGIFMTTEAKPAPRTSLSVVPVVTETMTGVTVGGAF